MAVSDRAAAIVPYAQQLLENNDVRDPARQAADATRAAYQRARGRDAREAVQDRKLRRRVTAAVAAMEEFLVTDGIGLRCGPPSLSACAAPPASGAGGSGPRSVARQDIGGCSWFSPDASAQSSPRVTGSPPPQRRQHDW